MGGSRLGRLLLLRARHTGGRSALAAAVVVFLRQTTHRRRRQHQPRVADLKFDQDSVVVFLVVGFILTLIVTVLAAHLDHQRRLLIVRVPLSGMARQHNVSNGDSGGGISLWTTGSGHGDECRMYLIALVGLECLFIIFHLVASTGNSETG